MAMLLEGDGQKWLLFGLIVLFIASFAAWMLRSGTARSDDDDDSDPDQMDETNFREVEGSDAHSGGSGDGGGGGDD